MSIKRKEADDKVRCKYCGKEVHKINLESHEEDCFKNPNRNSNLRGVGGWLIFFIVSLIINILVTGYDVLVGIEIISEFTLLTIPIFVEAAIVVIFTMSIVYLFKEDKRAIELLRWGLWLPLFSSVLLLFVLLLSNFSYEELADLGIFRGLAQGLIYALIWTSYLRKSERVKNTYYKKSHSSKTK